GLTDSHRDARVTGRPLAGTDAWEEHLERRPAVRRALDGDETAGLLDDLTHDRQAEAGSRGSGRRVRLHDMKQRGLVEAGAVVGHLEQGIQTRTIRVADALCIRE